MRFVTSNWYNAAAISEDNDLYLWGDNAYGQLGNGKRVENMAWKKIMNIFHKKQCLMLLKSK